jgi:glycosyltransferase involved in cell wall biosynthesis
MALGLTIVSTNVGGMPYLIDHNVDGVLVGKESPELMANAIIKLIKENNQRLSSKARVKAESFGWETVKEQWFKILQ